MAILRINELFLDDENKASEYFNNLIQEKDLEILDQLFLFTEVALGELNHKIKNTEFPDYSIELYLGFTYNLLTTSYSLLRCGYMAAAQIIMRSALEYISLCMYFFEFPEDEKIYRNSHKRFNLKLEAKKYPRWVQGYLRRIDTEGRVFKDIGNLNWEKLIFINLIEEASKFTHPNLDFVFTSIFLQSDLESKKDYFSLGPKGNDDYNTRNTYWRIVESSIYLHLVLKTVFKRYMVTRSSEVFTKAIHALNDAKVKSKLEFESDNS